MEGFEACSCCSWEDKRGISLSSCSLPSKLARVFHLPSETNLDFFLPSSRTWPCLPLCPNPSQQPRSASGCLQLDVIRHLPKAVSRRRLSSISFLINPKSEGSRSTLSVFFHCPLPDVRHLPLGTKLPEESPRRIESRLRRGFDTLATAADRPAHGTSSRFLGNGESG